MSRVANSKEGILQEGGRVGRTPLLGPGRHLLLRQICRLPDTHAPEIQTGMLHRTTLRLVRDGGFGSLDPADWLAGEAPNATELQATFHALEAANCLRMRPNGVPVLT